MLIRVNEGEAKGLKQGQNVWFLAEDDVGRKIIREGIFMEIVPHYFSKFFGDFSSREFRVDPVPAYYEMKVTYDDGKESVLLFEVFTAKEDAKKAQEDALKRMIAQHRACIGEIKTSIHEQLSSIKNHSKIIRKLRRVLKEARQA